ncbi:MAG: hypothetical protein ACK5XN_34690, partial [Bacteroidota bacterium]
MKKYTIFLGFLLITIFKGTTAYSQNYTPAQILHNYEYSNNSRTNSALLQALMIKEQTHRRNLEIIESAISNINDRLLSNNKDMNLVYDLNNLKKSLANYLEGYDLTIATNINAVNQLIRGIETAEQTFQSRVENNQREATLRDMYLQDSKRKIALENYYGGYSSLKSYLAKGGSMEESLELMTICLLGMKRYSECIDLLRIQDAKTKLFVLKAKLTCFNELGANDSVLMYCKILNDYFPADEHYYYYMASVNNRLKQYDNAI